MEQNNLSLFRWRFIFSLPSMRRILPRVVTDPMRKLREMFPEAEAIRHFISSDLLSLLSPPGIKKTLAVPPPRGSEPYKFEVALPDVALVPDIILDE